MRGIEVAVFDGSGLDGNVLDDVGKLLDGGGAFTHFLRKYHSSNWDFFDRLLQGVDLEDSMQIYERACL